MLGMCLQAESGGLGEVLWRSPWRSSSVLLDGSVVGRVVLLYGSVLGRVVLLHGSVEGRVVLLCGSVEGGVEGSV